VLVPAAAVQTSAGTKPRLRRERRPRDERIVTIGQAPDIAHGADGAALVEITNGLKAGDRVARRT